MNASMRKAIKIPAFHVMCAAACVAAALLFVQGAGAQTDTAGTSTQERTRAGISFPVPELGNCGSKEECRTYCADPENMEACIAFARARGLVSEEHAERAAKFAERLRAEGGPGGCTTPEECKTFCSDIVNTESCIAFAEKHELKSGALDEGKKIVKYLKSGGELPGGCRTMETCRAYCSDLSNAAECLSFARRANVGNTEQVAKFGELIEKAKEGGTPGGCTSLDACREYCADASHREECLAFGERVGILKKEAVDALRQGGMRGPGGCDSREACDAYCKDETNQDECFAFAEERGLIKKEDVEGAKNALMHIRTKLEGAPVEVRECIHSVTGKNIIEDIEAGTLVPGTDIGMRIKGCFERSGESATPKAMFDRLSENIRACIEENMGVSEETATAADSENARRMADAVRNCKAQQPMEHLPEGSQKTIENLMQELPQAIAQCVHEKAVNEGMGENAPREILSKLVAACAPSKEGSGEKRGNDMPESASQKAICLARIVGEERAKEIMQGGTIPDDIAAKVRACAANPVDPTDRPPAERSDVRMCPQVITPAQDPATGECKKFPTPCEVPEGWLRGCRVDSGVPSKIQIPPRTAPEGMFEMKPAPNGAIIPPPQTVPPPPPTAGNILLTPIRPFLEFLLGL